jgi:hypothetical protein
MYSFQPVFARQRRKIAHEDLSMKPSSMASEIVAASTGECAIDLRTGEGSHYTATRRMHKRLLMSVAVLAVSEALHAAIKGTFERLGVLFDMAPDKVS